MTSGAFGGIFIAVGRRVLSIAQNERCVWEILSRKRGVLLAISRQAPRSRACNYLWHQALTATGVELAISREALTAIGVELVISRRVLKSAGSGACESF